MCLIVVKALAKNERKWGRRITYNNEEGPYSGVGYRRKVVCWHEGNHLLIGFMGEK